MQICAIKNTEPKNRSVLLTAATGGLVGLGLKNFMPVTKSETDAVMFDQTVFVQKNLATITRNTFVENTKKQIENNPKDTASKLFLREIDSKTPEEKESVARILKRLPLKINQEFNKLKISYEQQIKAANNLVEATIKNAAKQSRSTATFVLPGIALGALGAYIYNIVGAIREK